MGRAEEGRSEKRPDTGEAERDASLLGVAMSRTLQGSFGSTGLALASTGRTIIPGSAPATPRVRTKPDVSDRIMKRYAAEVKASEGRRLNNFVPLDQREDVRPCERNMARTMKKDLDGALKMAGDEGIHWDESLGKEGFQKQLQYLHCHAKTGQFIEQYGAEGHFEGDFLYGMRHGKGEHEFRGEAYEGEWKWDMRHGWGTLSLGDGSQIKGEWQAGKPHGYASVIDARGTTTYEGEFKDGKRHGLGRQLFESGDMYDGGWREGRLHDRGVYYFTNGDKLYGMWNKGLYDGIGVFHYADGSISRRVYKDGRLMSVQDYEHSSQRFGKTLTRDGMQRHTADQSFPKDVFLLSSV